MQLENIKKIRELVSFEIQDKDRLNRVGTNELRLLCETAIRLDELIKRLSDPEKAKKEDKILNSKIWK